MARAGRKPLGAAHVERLEGSLLAKQRLTLILRTMRGELTVSEACRVLSICPSRDHGRPSRLRLRRQNRLRP